MAERPRERGDFKKARVNGGTDNGSLKDFHKRPQVPAAADRPASYGNQTICSTRIRGNLSKSAFLEGVGHFERRFQREGSVAHQLLLVSE